MTHFQFRCPLCFHGLCLVLQLFRSFNAVEGHVTRWQVLMMQTIYRLNMFGWNFCIHFNHAKNIECLAYIVPFYLVEDTQGHSAIMLIALQCSAAFWSESLVLLWNTSQKNTVHISLLSMKLLNSLTASLIAQRSLHRKLNNDLLCKAGALWNHLILECSWSNFRFFLLHFCLIAK